MEKNHYIKQLRKNDIVKFLKNAGFELIENLTDRKTGKKISPIQRYFDKKDNKVTILVRASKIKNEKENFEENILNYALLKSGLFQIPFFLNEYDDLDNKIILLLTDFLANEITFEEKKPIVQKAYTDLMIEKFGKQYVDDYNRFAKKHNAKLKKIKKTILEWKNKFKNKTPVCAFYFFYINTKKFSQKICWQLFHILIKFHLLE